MFITTIGYWFSMDSIKKEFLSHNDDCPVSSPFEDISFVVKHELLPIGETESLDNVDTIEVQGSLDSETSPVFTLGDIKQEAPSVLSQYPAVKVEIVNDDSWNSATVKQEEEDEITVEDHGVIMGHVMQLTCHQEEFVLGTSFPKEFCFGNVAQEKHDRNDDTCGKNDHNLIDAGKETYKCKFCDKESLRVTSLIRHIATHTVEKPFVCDFCSRGFSRKAGLKVHIRTHTGEKPYKCSKCSKIFTTSSALNMHTRIHLRSCTKRQSYECEVCSKIFATSSALYGHTRIHSIWGIQS